MERLAQYVCNLIGPDEDQTVCPSKVGETTYTNCGVTTTLGKTPKRVVTMNQGMTEFMLAMGLEGHMAGTAYLDDSIWPKYEAVYNAIPVLSSSYPTDAQIMEVNADFITANCIAAAIQTLVFTPFD